MGIFDKLKKEEVKESPKVVKKEPAVKSAKKKAAEKNESSGKVSKKEFNQAWRALKQHLVTEKTTNLGVMNKYAFEVFPDATKNEIKKAVRDLYGVKVESVNLVNVPGKKRRVGRNIGFRSGYKKAIVTIAQGESIEIIAG